MKLEISDRIKELQTSITESMNDLGEYELIVMAIRVLAQATTADPPLEYRAQDYEFIVERLEKLCAKHEIRLPEYREWASIELT